MFFVCLSVCFNGWFEINTSTRDLLIRYFSLMLLRILDNNHIDWIYKGSMTECPSPGWFIWNIPLWESQKSACEIRNVRIADVYNAEFVPLWLKAITNLTRAHTHSYTRWQNHGPQAAEERQITFLSDKIKPDII